LDIKQLSKQTIALPFIGQGAGSYSWNDTHIKTLREGIDFGMNFIDTAENYDDGMSEEIIGRAIKDIRKKVIIGTKFSSENSSYKDILTSVEGSLKRLNTDYIDLYQLHWPNPEVPFDETIKAMKQLVKWGKVRYIGVSNLYLKNLKIICSELGSGNLSSLQIEYNLFDRTIEEDGTLNFCEDNNILVIAFSPLSTGGIMYGEKQREALYAIAKKYHRSPAQIILRWLTSKSNVVTIPKAMQLQHLRENAASIDFDIFDNDIEFIDKNIKGRVEMIPVEKIRASEDDLDKFTTHPKVLTKYLHNGETLKPIRVVKSKDNPEEYDLVEGRYRYWAWRVSDFGEYPIKALIKE